MSTAPSGRPPASILFDAAGFVVDEAEVVFWGFCRDCQVAASAESIPVEQHTIREGDHQHD
jgi:Fur family ferric uptake transcriptional regulator